MLITVGVLVYIVFFFKQKTAYEMRISDWSSDVCSSDLRDDEPEQDVRALARLRQLIFAAAGDDLSTEGDEGGQYVRQSQHFGAAAADREHVGGEARLGRGVTPEMVGQDVRGPISVSALSEREHLTG